MSSEVEVESLQSNPQLFIKQISKLSVNQRETLGNRLRQTYFEHVQQSLSVENQRQIQVLLLYEPEGVTLPVRRLK